MPSAIRPYNGPKSIIESHWFKFLSTSRWNSNICECAHAGIYRVAYCTRGLLIHVVQHQDEATACVGRQILKSVVSVESEMSVWRGLEDSRHECIWYSTAQRQRNFTRESHASEVLFIRECSGCYTRV